MKERTVMTNEQSKPRFTPGPWKIDPLGARVHPGYGDDSFGLMIYGDEKRFDATGDNAWGTAWIFSHSPDGGIDSPLDDTDRLAMQIGLANAHLIAAAPELYEALEGMLATWCGPKKSVIVDEARAALAKARGESTQ